jgi:phage gpG-like protein
VAKTTDNTAKFQAAFRRSMAVGITRAAKAVSEVMKNSMTRAVRFKTSAPGTPPNRQRSSSGLAATLSHTTAKEVNGKFTASAGSALPYARIHEKGGTIRAKAGKFLPVPINVAAKRLMETHQGSLSKLPMTVIRTKGGKLYLMGVDKVRYRNKEAGLRVNNKPIFALRKSVRMPRRPWAAPALAKATKDGTIDRAIRGAVKQGVVQFTAGVAK